MWERQLTMMIEAGHADPETMADFGITYAAETGDDSLINRELFNPMIWLAGSAPTIYLMSMSQTETDRRGDSVSSTRWNDKKAYSASYHFTSMAAWSSSSDQSYSESDSATRRL